MGMDGDGWMDGWHLEVVWPSLRLCNLLQFLHGTREEHVNVVVPLSYMDGCMDALPGSYEDTIAYELRMYGGERLRTIR